MKKSDLTAILVLIAISGVIAYFLADTVIGKPQNDPVQVEKVTKIAPNFPTPDSRVFNEQAIDPTVEIQGGGQAADKPFGN